MLGHSPLQQGSLDSLCGMYAVINGLRCICPELDRSTSHDLFNELVAELPTLTDTPLAAVSWGIELKTLRGLLDAACQYVSFNLDITIKVRRLPGRKKISSVEELWRALEKALQPGCAAIVTLYGHHDHWTVASKATNRSLALFDSCHLKTVLRSNCSVGRPMKRHQLVPEEVIILSRAPNPQTAAASKRRR